MSKLFLSHSSHDNAAAVALRDWMQREGFGDVFLDTDPKRGIAAGERWERALHEAASRCEAVLFLVSRAWLASGWCLKEFNLAHRLNKRLFGVLIEDIPVTELPVNLTGTWQLVNLASGRDHLVLTATLPVTHAEEHVTFSAEGLVRLRTGLRRAGLDPSMFVWPPADDPKRTPYPGLRPLEAEDAGIYFGREAQIIEALDRIRALRTGAAPRLLCILGSSGAGKSSFLRAGLWPRLARDDEHFLPLPILRPERAALTGKSGLLSILEDAAEANGLGLTRAAIRQAIIKGAAPLRPVLTQIRDAAAHSVAEEEAHDRTERPLLVLPIDQGEELFLGEGAHEGGALLALLRDLVLEDAPALAVVLTIRSDAFERLQLAPALEGIALQTMTFGPMPRGIYSTIIEGPADRMREADRRLVVEPALTRALLDDLEAGGGRDALPLLAFTLERLWREYGGSGRLALADYEQLGRVRGSIEAGVQEVLRQASNDPRLPRDREAQLALLRRGLIPWLAGIDPDTGSPRRRVARRSEIPAEAVVLVDLLVEARLLSTDTDAAGEATVEPAHEALLRQWGLLQGWLEEDFAALTALEGVGRAAREWEANARGEAWLAHGGERLAEAERLLDRPDLAAQLDEAAREYLAACKRRVERELAKEQQRARQRRWLQWGASAAALIFAVLSLIALWQSWEAGTSRQDAIAQKEEAQRLFSVAKQEKMEAQRQELLTRKQEGIAKSNQSSALSALSAASLSKNPTVSAKLAIAAWPRSNSDHSPKMKIALQAISNALVHMRERRALPLHATSPDIASFSPDGTRLLSASADHVARLWDIETGKPAVEFKGHTSALKSATFSPDAKRLLSSSEDQTARLWDVQTGRTLAILAGHSGPISQAVFFRDGTRIITTALDDKTVRIWDGVNGRLLTVIDDFLVGNEDVSGSIAFSPDGTRVAVSLEDNRALLWDAEALKPVSLLIGHDNWLTDIAFSPDSNRIVTTSLDKTARIWETKSGQPVAILKGHTGTLECAAFSSDNNRIFTIASADDSAKLWNAKTGQHIANLDRDSAGYPEDKRTRSDIAFSPNGKFIATLSKNNLVKVWDSENGRVTQVLQGHSAGVTSVAFSPEGSRILTTSEDGTARLWLTHTGHNLAVLNGHINTSESAVFSPDGYFVLTTSFSDDKAQLWDAITGQNLASFQGYQGNIRISIFSPNSKYVLTTASKDKFVRIWDTGLVQTSAFFAGHKKRVRRATFSFDGKRILSMSDDGTARLWNATNGQALAVMNVSSRYPVRSAIFSPDGSKIVTVPERGSLTFIPPIPDDNTARVWDAKTGQLLTVLEGHEGGVNSAEFSPDSRRVVTASVDGTVRIWDPATGQPLFVLRGHQGNVFSASYSSNGSRILTASAGDSAARIWDAVTGQILTEFTEYGRGVDIAMFSDDLTRRILTEFREYGRGLNIAVFSPDSGRALTVASESNFARVWDVSTGKVLIELRGHENSLNSATFSADGRRILTTAYGDNDAKIWDAASGQILAEIKGGETGLNSAAFSPDGSRIITTGSGSNVARIWDATSGQALIELSGHKFDVESAMFSASGDRVVTTSADTTARLWNVAPIPNGNLLKVACALLPDYDLSDLAIEYGFTALEPICKDVARAPMSLK
ncbi:TIR domain-containing protein [Methylorubrum sp. GM97]|uniref:nSTAND1 domain-containing NTPase n=1 Tax=Methylorubrum sp. GM97 TaxID=2938232 RepID=UPI0021887908|nr:TIR domain-containing protein [Methylorubrum sp. GM97]BDL38612.1 hypothetical protein MSPGM_12020 [Methylorubrum sp. GM97]